MYKRVEWVYYKSIAGLYHIQKRINDGMTVVSDYVATARSKEDAQLISAAPDLLEACEVAQDALNTIKEQFKTECPDVVYKTIEQAINKAKGI